MMLKYILLGVIQGVTEFLPVSSSGHLVVMQKLLGINGNIIAVPVVLHLGTGLSLVVFFFKDIIRLLRDIKSLSLIIVVSVITGIIGIGGKDFFESLFSSVKSVAIALIFTGIILILTKKFKHGQREEVNFKDALALGFTQGMAIIPGISRSGITVSTLLFRKLDREVSFRFSFLASLPAIFGATLLEAKEIGCALQLNLTDLAVGFLASFLAGLLSLWVLRLFLRQNKFYYFGYYCIFIALTIFLFVK